MSIRIAKAYIKENDENSLHFLYENKDKNLIIRKMFDLNKTNEDKSLEQFISEIVKFETNGIKEYPKITISKSVEDSHNNK